MSEGRANGVHQGPGKRLGAKKSALELVVPGNIIFRQRGTQWYPGENCGMGRDHTIFAKEKGYVTYYKDEEKNPNRKYIGVVFERHMTLPRGRNEPRTRRLGLVGRQRQMGTLATQEGGEVGEITAPPMATADTAKGDEQTAVAETVPPRATLATYARPTSRKGYMYRPSNWEIGRAAEKFKSTVKLTRKEKMIEGLKKRKEKKLALLEERMMSGAKRKAKQKKGGKNTNVQEQ
ncbi:54S ribosomal protein L2 mitochondrial [Pseudocyphellaria aurata]|nr:54S ribosomal protein L2 mitochondrial [Pseudocyphellaria aurata]